MDALNLETISETQEAKSCPPGIDGLVNQVKSSPSHYGAPQATASQRHGKIIKQAVDGLEHLCTEKPGQASLINHYAKRLYELPIATLSLAPAALACIIGAAVVKFEDAYIVFTGRAKISRIFANPFYAKKILMADGSQSFQWKIRSMVPYANKKYDQMVEQGILRPGEHKLSNDPRVTTAGKYLRKYSVDEAPQVLQLVGQYLGRGLLYSPNNIYFFGNRPQSPDALKNASPKDRPKLREGPWGLVGLDCIGRGRPGHDNEANNNHRYSKDFREHFAGPTDYAIGKDFIKAIVNGANG